MIIRKLTETDYSEMHVLFRELDQLHVDARPDYFIHREEVFPQANYNAVLADSDCLLLGAFNECEKLIAVVRATLWNESGMVKTIKTVCLDDIYVVPEYRRQGVAARLFAEVEKWAKALGAVRLDLHAWDFNTGAISMYRAMGMTPQRYVFEKKL